MQVAQHAQACAPLPRHSHPSERAALQVVTLLKEQPRHALNAIFAPAIETSLRMLHDGIVSAEDMDVSACLSPLGYAAPRNYYPPARPPYY